MSSTVGSWIFARFRNANTPTTTTSASNTGLTRCASTPTAVSTATGGFGARLDLARHAAISRSRTPSPGPQAPLCHLEEYDDTQKQIDAQVQAQIRSEMRGSSVQQPRATTPHDAHLTPDRNTLRGRMHHVNLTPEALVDGFRPVPSIEISPSPPSSRNTPKPPPPAAAGSNVSKKRKAASPLAEPESKKPKVTGGLDEGPAEGAVESPGGTTRPRRRAAKRANKATKSVLWREALHDETFIRRVLHGVEHGKRGKDS